MSYISFLHNDELRIRKFLTVEKAKLLGNSFIESQFNYATLILMFCRKLILKTLKVIYNNTKSYDSL